MVIASRVLVHRLDDYLLAQSHDFSSPFFYRASFLPLPSVHRLPFFYHSRLGLRPRIYSDLDQFLFGFSHKLLEDLQLDVTESDLMVGTYY